MKTISNKMLKAILVSTLAVTTMIGCADNKNGDGNRVRVVGAGNSVTAPTQSGQYASVIATNNVQTDVSNLLGMNQGQLGTINTSGSIFMWGHAEFPQVTGNVQYIDSAVSYVAFQIYDSYALQGQAQPIVLSVGRNSLGSGFVTNLGGGNYTVDVQFKDQAGWIRLSGNATTNGGNFSGTITYGMNSGAQGTLGQFTIPTCSFFKCQ